MDRRPDADRWLANEHEEQEDAAEAAFAQMFTALPRVEPSAGFVDRTVHVALRRRARRRAAMMVARVAACTVIAAAGFGLAYVALAYAGASIFSAGVATAARVLAKPIVFVATRVEWWSILARAAAGVGEAIATPQTQAVLIAGEVIGVLAVYGLQRLLRTAPVMTDSWEART